VPQSFQRPRQAVTPTVALAPASAARCLFAPDTGLFHDRRPGSDRNGAVGAGRFNLAQGAVGAMIGIAASMSTLTTGFLFQGIGPAGGFIATAAVAGAATASIWVFVSEAKPSEYSD